MRAIWSGCRRVFLRRGRQSSLGPQSGHFLQLVRASAERVEREKVVSAERERNSVETRENQRRMIYESCILNARQNYDANWSAACRSDAERNAKLLRDCLNDRQILNNQFMGADYCKKTYGEVDASPSCSLPNSQSNSINAFHKQAQEKCVTEARLGLM